MPLGNAIGLPWGKIYGSSGGPSGPSDPYFDDVVLLMHFNGAQGGTVFTDDSKYDHSFTAVGNAVTDTSNPKFGSADLYTGSGSGYASLDAGQSLTPFELGVGDVEFTLECWVNIASPSSTQAYISRGGGLPGWNGTNGNQWMLFSENNYLYWQWWSSAGVQTIAAPYSSLPGGSFSANTWHHIAATFEILIGSSVSRLYFDGVHVGQNYGSYLSTTSSDKVRVGASAYGHFLNGHMDDVRITNGVARYTGTGSFTPPTSEFPNGTTSFITTESGDYLVNENGNNLIA